MTTLQAIRRAQLLSKVLPWVTGLICTIAIVVVALQFTDRGRPYILPLCVLNVALGVGNHILRRMVEHTAKQADPDPTGRLMAMVERTMEQMREIERRPKPSVQVSIRPVPAAPRRYAITVHNGSPDTLIDGSLNHSWLLHPGKFGLDDTHMPRDIWEQPPMRFEALGPGEQITSDVLGYDVVERYDGPKDSFVTIDAVRVTSAGDSLGAAGLTASVRMDW